MEYPDCIAVIANNTGREFIFDKDMKAILQGWGWNENGPGYLHARVKGKMTFAHHLVAGKPGPGYEVDHINRDPRDNRRENLRVVTVGQNHVNSGLRRNNATGFKGVCFDRGKGKFMAIASAGGRNIFIGRFDRPEDAARAYDRKIVELYGDQACTNAKLGLLVADRAVLNDACG